jgi:tetratricopeptide (TPR) repeat protein
MLTLNYPAINDDGETINIGEHYYYLATAQDVKAIGVDFADSRHVAGISGDPRQIRNRAFHAAAQILRRISAGAEGGALLLLEDLHWADDGTLDFLEYLVEVGRDAAVLVIALARPALLERRSGWGADPAVHRRIELVPLDAGSSTKLASELLRRRAAVPAELHELIVGRAEGNPFYMEELVTMLVDKGAIETSTSGWTLNPLLASEVPATLTGILQARLDSLPRQERLALQHASVIGQVFWDRALAALDEQAADALPALVRGRLVVAQAQSRLGEVREYAFSHQILHQVTYSTLLKRSRRELHARVAAWLAGLPRAADFLGATAEHYALAGDLDQATLSFASAAEHARSRFAHEVALTHVDKALGLLERLAVTPESLAIRWRLLFVREATFNMQGRRAEQPAVLDSLQQVADSLDDDRLRALAARRRSQFALRTADFVLQESAARQAIVIAGRAGDIESRLEAQRLLADALNAQGDPEEARAMAREGLEEARSRGLRRAEGVFLNTLAYIATQQDDLVTGLALDLEDLPIWRELGDPFGEAIALGNVGADWLWFGQIEQARSALDDALKLFRSVGARQLVCSPLANLSMLALWQGDGAQALALANEALDAAVAVRAVDFEAQTLCRVGDAELALGRDAAAEAAFARAESLARKIGSAVEHEAIAGRARVALARDEVASAMQVVDTLLARGDPKGAEARAVLFTCWRVLDRAGDTRAPGLLAAAHHEVQSRAATMRDPVLRASFLERVPDNRLIVEAWQAVQAGSRRSPRP